MAKTELRQALFQILTQDRDSFHSGQEICDRLGVSRTAVWKEVGLLREAGYEIESVTNKGYRLVDVPDDLTGPLFAMHLGAQRAATLHCYEETDSTNTRALQLSLQGAPSGTVAIADHQTSGNGRLGRKFDSPGGVGVYFSYLLRPDCETSALSLLTSYAGLAVCEALEGYGLAPTIKWPNDIILDHRKVCGILTKLTGDGETAVVSGAVIGIGINVHQRREDFPEELRDKATSVLEGGVTVKRAELCARVIDRLDEIFLRQKLLQKPSDAIIPELRHRSCTVGSKVMVVSPTDSRPAEAIDIAPDAGLVVRFEDTGEVRTVTSGEVSVRGMLGYT